MSRLSTFAVIGILAAGLLIAAGVAASRERAPADCNDSSQSDRCAHMARRIAAHCAAHPDDERCARWAAQEDRQDRHRTYCADHPDEFRCMEPAEKRQYCREHPDEPRCSRH